MRSLLVSCMLAIAACATAPQPAPLELAPEPEITAPAGADLVHLSTAGEDVPALEAHAPSGKVTVFDFYADWCAPCRHVDSYVYGLLEKRQDVAYRKINIGSWETPVAKRYLAKVTALPYVVVYGRDGKMIGEISGLDVDMLDKTISEAASR